MLMCAMFCLLWSGLVCAEDVGEVESEGRRLDQKSLSEGKLPTQSNAPPGCKVDYEKRRYVCLDGSEVDVDGNIYKDGKVFRADINGGGLDVKDVQEPIQDYESYKESYESYSPPVKSERAGVDKIILRSGIALGLDGAFVMPLINADNLNPGFGAFLGLDYYFSESLALGFLGGHVQTINSGDFDVSVGYSIVMAGFKLGFFEVDFGYNRYNGSAGILALTRNQFGAKLGLFKQFDGLLLSASYFAPDVSGLSEQGMFLATVGFRIFP